MDQTEPNRYSTNENPTRSRKSQAIKMTNHQEKYQNKYRIPSARAQWWDYSANGCYFITICTANRTCILGNIENGIMQLSSIGKIVNNEWNKSFEIRAELSCDIFVIMPNHIHAILRINNPVGTHGRASDYNIGKPIETHGRASLQPQRSPKSISSFVAGFKSSATKQINIFCNTPHAIIWQSRFHDHIIRNDAEHQRIIDYIQNNPAKWEQDKFYS